MNYKNRAGPARENTPPQPSSYDTASPVSVEEVLSRLRRARPFLDMPERRLRTVIMAVAEALSPGERIDVTVLKSDEKQLRRWDDEGGAGGWS